MKSFFAFFILALITISCATIPPQVNEFKAIPDRIEEGSKTTIYWNVSGAESITIEGIGENLMPSGSKEIQLTTSSNFKMIVSKGKEIVTKSIFVEVYPKVVEKKKSIPIIEKRNTEKTNYLKGVINAENVKDNDNLQLNINLIDLKGYPQNIKLFCTVKDQYGNHIANLAPPYNSEYIKNWKSLFEEIEGKDHQISNFSVEEIREDVAPPFTTSFILDYSGSMVQDFQFVNSAIAKAASYIRPNKDDYEVIQFDHRVYKSVDLTSNPNNIQSILSFDSLAGFTAFYKASHLGLSDLSKSTKEKVAILFTDGADNASLFTANDIILKARMSGIKVFIIGFNRPFGGFLSSILESIAIQTGGKAYFPKSLNELDDIFAEIYQIMNVYYVVTYTASKVDGNIRVAKLNLEFPGLNKTLTASKAYYVKPEPIDEERTMSVAWFKTGKSVIQDDYMQLIKDIAQILKDVPTKKIIITGHTDSQGSDAINNILSLKRAKAVAKILLDLGVSKKQIIKIEGKGEKELLYPNEINDYEKQGNRRVDIKLI